MELIDDLLLLLIGLTLPLLIGFLCGYWVGLSLPRARRTAPRWY